ncbi:hypothetical protein HHL19_16160 [Streptomyces sp. R302]|uniref:hypothetical protein n=1 Tax=unclassified Streptomyces TaxID=2593676 RepID=UPI00145DD4AE|nr:MULTISPECIES: hypothetical protein [unclassified Streptomyces]NML55307.1 hypothetical protein [Streptomyces sp. R301]NML80179.1 hypothetical protein [Streptomyces sp. R302]
MDTSQYKGIVDESDDFAVHLEVLAGLMPVGTSVWHRSGRQGTVITDHVPHIPGVHSGKPSHVAFADETLTDALVCVSWDNELGLRWICWARLDDISKKPPVVLGGSRR